MLALAKAAAAVDAVEVVATKVAEADAVEVGMKLAGVEVGMKLAGVDVAVAEVVEVAAGAASELHKK